MCIANKCNNIRTRCVHYRACRNNLIVFTIFQYDFYKRVFSQTIGTFNKTDFIYLRDYSNYIREIFEGGSALNDKVIKI